MEQRNEFVISKLCQIKILNYKEKSHLENTVTLAYKLWRNLTFTFLFFQVIGLKDLTTTDPRSEVYPPDDEYKGAQSRVLRFAVAAGMYLLVGLFQVI